MRLIEAEEIGRLLTYPRLIAALRAAFCAEVSVPVRHHHTIARPDTGATLLLMPAWGDAPDGAAYLGTKIVTVFPGNVGRGLPSLAGTYVLMAGDTGAPLAVMEGRTLTAWRTAAASALAADYLARADASHLVMVGAGVLAPHLVRAHASVRPIRTVTLWNRSRGNAARLAGELAAEGFAVRVADDLEAAVRAADIVSCATLATAPLVQGGWLKPGAHLDLVGGFRPHMREADDVALRRSRVYVDSRTALTEAGDLADPLARGVISPGEVLGDLFGLCRSLVRGRETGGEITLFKSVGNAVEDLAAAILVWRGAQASP